jgi:hypothetical protein
MNAFQNFKPLCDFSSIMKPLLELNIHLITFSKCWEILHDGWFLKKILMDEKLGI